MKNKNFANIDGHDVKFTRRRYGSRTFTWVHVYLNGEWVSLGDPWQAVMPAKAEILRQIEKVVSKRCGLIKRIFGIC